MKKLLLVSAVAALSVTSAYATTGVYGKVGADLRYAEDGDVTLDNKHTRLGVKGATAITAATNAIYQAELGLDIDAEADGKAKVGMRDTYVGLQNNDLGTLLAGRLTTIDDAVNFTNPSDYWNSGYQASFDAARVNNAIAYASPNFSGFQGLAMYQVDSSDDGGQKGKAGDAGTYGVAGKYEEGNIKAGASYIDLKNGGNVVRASGAVKVVPQVELSGAYQTMDFDKDNLEKENSYIVAAKYDVPNSPMSAYVEYDKVENKAGIKDADNSIVSLGGNYAFNKAVEGRAYVGFEDPEGGDSTYGFGTGLTYKF